MPKRPEPWQPAGWRAAASGDCRDYDLVIFDLDGTLADSFAFFLDVYGQLATRHGLRPIQPWDVEALRNCSPREVMAHVGLPGWRLPWVARDFVRAMQARGQEVRLFEGVGDALHYLRAHGLLLAVVSSNSAGNCRRILGHDISRLMACIDGGASIFGKGRRIRRVLQALDVPPGRAIYVGDQPSDADAARTAGVAFGAVCWGYAAPALLQQADPAETFRSVAALKALAVSCRALQHR